MKNDKQNLSVKLLGQPTPAKTAGVAFSAALVLPTLLALLAVLVIAVCGLTPKTGEMPDWYLYINYTLTPLAFALVVFWALKYNQKPIKTAFKENRCKAKYYLLALALQFGLFSLGTLNTYFLEFLGKFGYQDTPIQLPSMDGFGLVGVLLVVAVLPAIFEELLFRGLVLRGLKSFGTAGTVLLCGGLFAIYHQNPAQTIYQFCCGAAFALMAIRAESVFPTVVSHFVNNALIVILTKYNISILPSWLLIVFALCLIGVLAYLIFFEKNNEKTTQNKQEKKSFFLFAAVGIVICLVNWLAVILTGFGG